MSHVLPFSLRDTLKRQLKSAIDGYKKFVINSPHGESFQTQLDTIISSVTEVRHIRQYKRMSLEQGCIYL